MARNYSYFFRVQNVPDPQFRKQLMDAAQEFMDAGFMRELLDRRQGVNATLARLEQDQDRHEQYRHPTPGLRSYTACLTHLQRLTARIEKLRDEACFAAAQQVYLQTGRRLPPVEDMDKPASEQATKAWKEFENAARQLQAGLQAKSAAPVPAAPVPAAPVPADAPAPAATTFAPPVTPPRPAPEPASAGLSQVDAPRPITGKELKVYVSLLVKARVPQPLREQVKQQARQGHFSLSQLRQVVADLTTTRAA